LRVALAPHGLDGNRTIRTDDSASTLNGLRL